MNTPNQTNYEPRSIELLDPKKEYDYPPFEEMLQYGLKFIERQFPEEEEVEISDFKRRGTGGSWKIQVGDKACRVKETGLQIFCFLCSFEGEILSLDNIIGKGLSTLEEARDVADDNIWTQVGRWNRDTHLIPNIQIPSPNQLGLGKLGGLFIGELKEKIIYDNQKGFQTLQKGNSLIIKIDGVEVLKERMYSKYLKTFKILLQRPNSMVAYERFKCLFPEGEINTKLIDPLKKIRNIPNLDKYIQIDTIYGVGYKLHILLQGNMKEFPNDRVNGILDSHSVK